MQKDLYSVCTSGEKISTRAVYSILLQLEQSSTLPEFWNNFFHICKDDLGWLGCCIVFLDKNSVYVESSSSHDKYFDQLPTFLTSNPEILSVIERDSSKNFMKHDLNFDENDEFLSCWLPNTSFDHLFIHPFTSIKTPHAAIIVASPHVQESNETDWKDLISLFLLFSTQLYEKLLLDQTLELSKAAMTIEDKFITLGHLTAGIAHEINSPLGALTAASGNIKEAHKKISVELPEILKKITPKTQEALLQLLTLATSPKEFLSSREERAKKKAIIAALESNGFTETDRYADILVEIGIYQDVSQILKDLGDDLSLFLSFIFNFASIDRNNDNITSAAERAVKMISAIKNYSKRDESGELRLHNIRESIETVLSLYHNDLKHDINLITNFQDVPDLLCNQDELYQVWTNLIYNSLHAMNNKGTLEINLYQENGSIIVSISDTGTGIDEKIQHRIFEPYFTTKPRGQGSGIGLDIVKKIIAKHKGTIHFNSKPGATTFFVCFPNTQFAV